VSTYRAVFSLKYCEMSTLSSSAPIVTAAPAEQQDQHDDDNDERCGIHGNCLPSICRTFSLMSSSSVDARFTFFKRPSTLPRVHQPAGGDIINGFIIVLTPIHSLVGSMFMYEQAPACDNIATGRSLLQGGAMSGRTNCQYYFETFNKRALPLNFAISSKSPFQHQNQKGNRDEF
jgi:hypothetical protein